METEHDDCNKDPSVLEAILDEDLLKIGTENSVSDCEGSIQEAPSKASLGLKERHVIFGQAANQGAFQRVCGNKEGAL